MQQLFRSGGEQRDSGDVVPELMAAVNVLDLRVIEELKDRSEVMPLRRVSAMQFRGEFEQLYAPVYESKRVEHVGVERRSRAAAQLRL